MLKLFQSIFGGTEKAGRYPESLVEAAIERAVDGTDRRLRALSGYKKQLRPAVIHAIDHVVELVDRFPAPAPAGRADYGTNPCLRALFSSAGNMLEMFGHNAGLEEFSTTPDKPVIALLLAEHTEKKVLGVDLVGDRVQHDVAQVVVNFSGHRLIEPAANEKDARRQLKRRAFDHLLTLALARIADVRGSRAELSRQRDLLRRKLGTLEQSGWSLETEEGTQTEPGKLNAELQAIESELEDLGADSGELHSRLDIVTKLLGNAEEQLWSTELVIHLDRMNIKRSAQAASAKEITMQELHNARGQHKVALMVSLTPKELPERENFYSAAARYLT